MMEQAGPTAPCFADQALHGARVRRDDPRSCAREATSLPRPKWLVAHCNQRTEHTHRYPMRHTRGLNQPAKQHAAPVANRSISPPPSRRLARPRCRGSPGRRARLDLLGKSCRTSRTRARVVAVRARAAWSRRPGGGSRLPAVSAAGLPGTRRGRRRNATSSMTTANGRDGLAPLTAAAVAGGEQPLLATGRPRPRVAVARAPPTAQPCHLDAQHAVRSARRRRR